LNPVAGREVIGLVCKSILIRAPLDKILPEDNTAKRGKTWQVKPATRGRVGNSSADGKLFGVQGLIQSALFQHVGQSDSTKLFFVWHFIVVFEL